MKKFHFLKIFKNGISIFKILIGIKYIKANKKIIINTNLFDGLIFIFKSSKKPTKNIRLHKNKYSNKIFE